MNKALLDILKVGGLFWYMVVLFSDKFFINHPAFLLM